MARLGEQLGSEGLGLAGAGLTEEVVELALWGPLVPRACDVAGEGQACHRVAAGFRLQDTEFSKDPLVGCQVTPACGPSLPSPETRSRKHFHYPEDRLGLRE